MVVSAAVSGVALLTVLAAATALAPQRQWLDRLALLVPGPAATRWLLLADLACLVVIGLARGRWWLGVPLAVGAGFTALNGLGLAANDFYLALAAFHPLVGLATLGLAGRGRWLGAVLVAAALALAALT